MCTSRNKGFTLVELMVALAVSSIVVVLMYSLYKVHNQSSVVQANITSMQQDLRVAGGLLAKDIRVAGYDPLETGKYGISGATKDSLQFTADTCADGNSPGSGCAETEVFSIQLTNEDNGVSDLERASGEVVAQNIEQLEFCYFENDDTQCRVTPNTIADIRAVTVSILVRSIKEDSSYLYEPNATGVAQFTSGSGADWSPQVANSYRRRLLVKTVRLRNIGL